MPFGDILLRIMLFGDVLFRNMIFALWHSVLKRHVKSEHGNLPFKCVFCIYFCKTKDEMLAHVKMSHPEMQNISPKQSLATLGNPLKCDFCIYFCKSKDKLLSHMKMSHPEIQICSTKEDSTRDNQSTSNIIEIT